MARKRMPKAVKSQAEKAAEVADALTQVMKIEQVARLAVAPPDSGEEPAPTAEEPQAGPAAESLQQPEPTSEPDGVTDPLQAQLFQRHRTLEARLKQGRREFAESLTLIIEERTYRALGYDRLEDYTVAELGLTRKTAYLWRTWWRACVCLERHGVKDPFEHLAAEAALVFRTWEERPEIFYLAYARVVERGQRPTQVALEAEAIVQSGYLREADLVPDLTPEEYEAYQRLSDLPYTYELDRDFDSTEKLIGECRARRRKPPLKVMAKLARGPDLLELIRQLEGLAEGMVRVRTLKRKRDELAKQKRELSRNLGEQMEELDEQIAALEPENPSETDEAAEEEEEDSDLLLDDFELDPKAFLAEVAARLAVVAEHTDVLGDTVDDVPPLLNRIAAAVETIRLSVQVHVRSVDEAFRGDESDVNAGD